MEKYRAIPQGYMTAGAVAKKMGVTVRTLQHYDKEGLLSPSAMSEGGRRLYTDKDIIKLHQILSLKHLGFSLDDIRDRLIPLDNPTDVAQILSEQAAIVREKTTSLTESLSKIEALKAEVLEILKDGEIAFQGTVMELTEKIGKHYNIHIQTDKGTEHYESDDIGNSLLAILKNYQEKNTMIQDIQVDRGSLEQHFLKIAKGE